jgi:Rrf2 family protein
VDYISRMLSKKAKYALEACIALAKAPTGVPMMIQDIADQERIPKKFLELILLELRNDGVLTSKKGKGGGYYLAKSPRQITMGQIIRLIEGPIALVPCVSQTAYQPCHECCDEHLCGIRMVMKEVRDATSAILDRTTLQDVLDRIRLAAQSTEEILDYSI